MKDFLLYPEALALKELGFDEPCFGYFHDGKLSGVNKWDRKDWEFHIISNKDITNTIHEIVLAPTYSQAFRFFREKYDWQHSIDPTADQHSHKLGYNYWIWNYKTGEEHYTMPKNRPTGDWEYETYEEAELACLQKLIEIVKKAK